MPGDVGLVAALLTKVFGFVVDPTGYEQLSREIKLRTVRRGLSAAIENNDWDAADTLFDEYRQLRTEAGP